MTERELQGGLSGLSTDIILLLELPPRMLGASCEGLRR
jgi:hypothetical protein